MLGITSYQEALRALGRLVEQSSDVTIAEHAESGWLELSTAHGTRQVDAAELEEIIVASLALRGQGSIAGETADVLRAVGQALDQLHALDLGLVMNSQRLSVRFSDEHARSHELSYAGEELDALRRAAVARRNGQPLRRILILQASPESARPLLELLLAEFAVQALPVRYARAVALSAELPDLVLGQVAAGTLEALRTLRSGKHSARVPIVALAGPECDVSSDALFAAGADDVLQEPVLPAQLRARLRTWLLRGQASSE
jgi:CheY-like chemotaxis protein